MVKMKTKAKTGPRKAAGKKTVKKKLTAGSGKRRVPKKGPAKKTAKKSSVRRSDKKKAKKKTAALEQRPAKKVIVKSQLPVEPGPPSGSVPPVEEPTRQEDAVGIVTHYYSHLGVAVVQVNKGALSIGDTVHIKGHTTDFTQRVDSLEHEHQHVDRACAGQSVGLKVNDHAREHDIVYVVK